jgi:hypothetical protein
LEDGVAEQLDFDSLNDDLRSAHECKVEGCTRRVAVIDTFCMRCFAGLLTHEVIQEDGRYMKNPDYKPQKGRGRGRANR